MSQTAESQTIAPSTTRPPTPREAAIIAAFLSKTFVGAAELRAQTVELRVRQVFDDGTLDLIPSPDTPGANVLHRVPVEGEYDDDDGVPVLVLLHVVEGRLNELEVVKADGTPIRRPPTAERLDVTEAR